MNFFKKFYRRKTLSILDDTQEKEADLSNGRPPSSNLRRSEGLIIADNYDTHETKLFEEPLPVTSVVKNNVQSAEEPANHSQAILPTATQPFVGNSSYMNMNHHTSVESEGPRSPVTTKQATSHHVRLPSTLPDAEHPEEMKLLYAAIIRGEKGKVKKILTEHLELLEASDNFGRTPLMYCVLADRIDCAKLMLKMKANLHQKDKAGRSAIHLAAHKGGYKFVELLYERGANIEMQDNDGQTPLHLITRNRHVRCLDFFLRHLRPGMAEVTDNQNRTALHWSAAFNNEESVRLLIKYHCNPAVSDDEGKTPLHWAANTHDPSVVATIKTLLFSSPSALNWQDYEGRTALHFAVAHENVAAVEFLLNFAQEKCEVDRLDNTFRTPLHWAAQLGNSNIVKLLLSVGAKNSISDEYGATPLLYAALHNKSDVISVMMQHDPNILEQADIEGRTALMWAAGKGSNDVIALLLGIDFPPKAESSSPHSNPVDRAACTVDINRVDNKGNTALHMAAWNGHSESVEMLLGCNAKHDLQNNMNHTPIVGACEKGHLAVVEHLLDRSASIIIRDLEDRTPLHWAAIGGHADVCDLLIATGLDPDVRDNLQRTPLHCAAFGGFINCMNVLLENRANVDLQDQEGMSALHWAAQSGHMDATKLLFQCSAFPNLMEFTEERLTPLDHALLNEREEVAQYFIEQGALSSETIRDIAAARIQACYRGYQVRKAFLNRKNLLIQHELLKDRNRARKKPTMSSTDRLNSVGEEPLPATSVAPSVSIDNPLSSGDEVTIDDRPDTKVDMKTIKSALEVCVIEKEKSKRTLEQVDFHEESEVAIGQKSEDRNSPPLLSQLLPARSFATSPGGDRDVSSGTRSRDASATERGGKGDSQERESSFLTDTSTTIEIHVTADRRLKSKKTTDLSAIPSADTTTDDGGGIEKRKKKKKSRPIVTVPDSTSSDRASADLQKKKAKLRTRDRQVEKRKKEPRSGDSLPPSTDDFKSANSTATVPSSIKSDTSFLINISRTPTPPTMKHASSSPSSSLKDERLPSSHSSSVNDLDNIGSDDKIVVVPVSGLAYPSSSDLQQPHSNPSPAGSSIDATLLSSDLSLSEYIEGLMALSLSERKMLSSIQRNRKQAFQQANAAATTIQQAWRRFMRLKKPLKTVAADNQAGDVPTESRLSTASAEFFPPMQSSISDTRPSTSRSAISFEGTSSSKSAPKERGSASGKSKSASPWPLPSPPPGSEDGRSLPTTKKKLKKGKRPQTSAAPRPGLTERPEKEGGNTLTGTIVSDVDSEYLSRTRKVRAKTSHSKSRRHLESNSSNQDINRKIKDLCKVYGTGPTVVLAADQKPSPWRPSLRTLVTAAPRPRTSMQLVDFADPRFFDPRSYDPVTAVQSYSLDGWGNSWEKKPPSSMAPRSTSPTRKRSLRRKKQAPSSRAKAQSLQWKKSYGAFSGTTSRGAKSTATSSTRFSYNLSGAKN